MIQIYGWGTTSFQGPSPDKLLEATVPVVTKETCQTKWPNVEDGMICAGGEEGTDSCQVFLLDFGFYFYLFRFRMVL